MSWIAIAFKNILRRPILTMAGIAVAVAMLFTLLELQRGYEEGLCGELADLRRVPVQAAPGVGLLPVSAL